jgi:hypothetical protein
MKIALAAAAAALAVSALPALARPSHTQDSSTPNWALDATDGPTLSWGSGDEEEPQQVYSCPHHGVIQVNFNVDHRPHGRTPPVVLASGATRATATGRAQPEEMNGGAEITVSLPAAAPVFAAFRRSGRIRLQVGSETVTSGVARTSMVTQFLHYCTN